jgi:hypothetical protein
MVPFPDDWKHIPPVALDELVLVRARGMKVKPVKARIDEPLCERDAYNLTLITKDELG